MRLSRVISSVDNGKRAQVRKLAREYQEAGDLLDALERGGRPYGLTLGRDEEAIATLGELEFGLWRALTALGVPAELLAS